MFILLFLLLLQIPGQDLPPDSVADYGKLNWDYEEIRYSDTVTLDGSWWAALRGKEINRTVRFDERPTLLVNGVRTLHADYKGEILKLKNWPKCYGSMQGEQKPFYIEDVAPEGFTLRGKSGITVEYTCRVIAKRAK